jgi:hypothetical protein
MYAYPEMLYSAIMPLLRGSHENGMRDIGSLGQILNSAQEQNHLQGPHWTRRERSTYPKALADAIAEQAFLHSSTFRSLLDLQSMFVCPGTEDDWSGGFSQRCVSGYDVA